MGSSEDREVRDASEEGVSVRPRGATRFRLNLGCGRAVRPAHNGWVNVDYESGPGVDIRLDLNSPRYPFKSNSVDEILASHVLEHLENPFKILAEWHRILKPGGRLELIVPHRKARGVYVVTHRTFFDEHSLSPVTSRSDASLEHQPLFAVDRLERHFTVLGSQRLTYHVHKRLPWTMHFPLGRIWQLRWILVKR